MAGEIEFDNLFLKGGFRFLFGRFQRFPGRKEGGQLALSRQTSHPMEELDLWLRVFQLQPFDF